MTVNIYAIGQNGRLAYEALLCFLSIKRHSKLKDSRLVVCTPVNSDLWNSDPDLHGTRFEAIFREHGIELAPFVNEDFGSSYPHSNKMYALSCLPADEPFIFLDSDNVFYGDIEQLDLDFQAPTYRQAATKWPHQPRAGTTKRELWDAIYGMFGLSTDGWYREEFEPQDDRTFPYFNAGVFYGAKAGAFFEAYRHVMLGLSKNPPPKVLPRYLDPFLDQVVLPLALKMTGGKNDLIGHDFVFNRISKHYFAGANLFFPPNTPELRAALEVVTDPELRPIFAERQEYADYFLGDKRRVMEDLARELEAEGRFKKGQRISNRELKTMLMLRELWFK